MTRREMLAGCLAGCLAGLGLAGAAVCFPRIAHGAEAASSDADEAKTKQIVWNELKFDVPASFEWNETGDCNGIQVECPVYSGFDNGIAQVFFVKRWTVDDFSEDSWANLLTCDLTTWIDCVVTTDTMLLGFDYWDAKSYNNGSVRILAVFGKDHEYSDQKKVCAMATDGTSIWYICLFFTDNNDDDATQRAVDLILGSATLAQGEADSIDSTPLIAYEKETLETQGLSIDLPVGYRRNEDEDNTWCGWVAEGVFYQVSVSTFASKGSDDWELISYMTDPDVLETIFDENYLSDPENSDIVLFGSKEYLSGEVESAALFCYGDSDPDTDVAAIFAVGRERAWVVAVQVQCHGDDAVAISFVDQIAESLTDEVETKRGKATLLEKSKAKAQS